MISTTISARNTDPGTAHVDAVCVHTVTKDVLMFSNDEGFEKAVNYTMLRAISIITGASVSRSFSR